ncbi:MAG: hypothetical protein LBK95_04765 [Bifidobacteriaceae bacterium]|nr:hypothetical protein [Bifidobacteriaceae bacterium]
MESPECLPVDEATRNLIMATANPGGADSHSGTWDRMVYVGEGNAPGEDWWVVGVLWGYPPGAELHQDGAGLDINSYLTNQPGLPDGRPGMSLEVGGPGQVDWSGIEWDDDRRRHGLEMQESAFDCVRAVAPQEG